MSRKGKRKSGKPPGDSSREPGSVNLSHNIRKDEKTDKRMLSACLYFGGGVLGVVAAGTWTAYWPGGQGGDPSRAQLLAVFTSLFCAFASVVNMFVAYGK